MASVILIRGSATFCIPTNNNDSVIFTESLSSTGLLFGRLDLPIVYHLRINAMQNNMRVIYVLNILPYI